MIDINDIIRGRSVILTSFYSCILCSVEIWAQVDFGSDSRHLRWALDEVYRAASGA